MKTEEIVLSIEQEQSLSPSPKFPTYTASFINNTNQVSQATRPKHVGQLSELFRKDEFKSVDKWKKWYESHNPEKIDKAVTKILGQIEKQMLAYSQITPDLVRSWVEDLVITKTYNGLRIQDWICSDIANKYDKHYRISTAEEESRNIDAYIAEVPLTIKPLSYKSKQNTKVVIEHAVVVLYSYKKGIISYSYNEKEFEENLCHSQAES